ncbi:hypothetical protein FA95DRAFT_1573679 [Auriscalpium vulgare]|uniref:Uncharacterized protein n=1 Tax=Auriscalpium vulgare TaxID=40419 RepID=A0ACB8RP94_9AGAM|nr:hypothetical protein FA95DRAFT_1573679 [Auriscalpium vulgare]
MGPRGYCVGNPFCASRKSPPFLSGGYLGPPTSSPISATSLTSSTGSTSPAHMPAMRPRSSVISTRPHPRPPAGRAHCSPAATASLRTSAVWPLCVCTPRRRRPAHHADKDDERARHGTGDVDLGAARAIRWTAQWPGGARGGGCTSTASGWRMAPDPRGAWYGQAHRVPMGAETVAESTVDSHPAESQARGASGCAESLRGAGGGDVDVPNFIAALNEDTSSAGDGAGQRSFLFPNLRHNRFLEFDFRVVFRRAGDDYVVTLFNTFLDDLESTA